MTNENFQILTKHVCTLFSNPTNGARNLQCLVLMWLQLRAKVKLALHKLSKYKPHLMKLLIKKKSDSI